MQVDYEWSESLDLGVTIWDSSIGNLIFKRVPLVAATVTPPGNTIFNPGDTVSFTGHWESSTNRNENIFAYVAAFLPVGPMRILDRTSPTLSPFGEIHKPFNVTIPVNLPGAMYGTTTGAVATVVDGEVKHRSDFSITIQ